MHQSENISQWMKEDNHTSYLRQKVNIQITQITHKIKQ